MQVFKKAALRFSTAGALGVIAIATASLSIQSRTDSATVSSLAVVSSAATAAIPQAPEKPKIAIESLADRMNQAELKIKAEKKNDNDGWELQLYAGNDGTVPVGPPSNKPYDFTKFDFSPFANQGTQRIVARWTKAGVLSDPSDTALVEFDTIGPMVSQVKLIGQKGGKATLEIHFERDDLKNATTETNYKITRLGGADTFATETGFKAGKPAPGADPKIVLIEISDMVTDNYQVEVKESLVDTAGNKAGYMDGIPKREQKRQFTSYPDRAKGEHVEFPDFVPRPKQAPGGFNPGDKVETRVARLYYFRDAHRVAEIINRNVQSFNRAAVDQKRREAESSRERADTATDERRANEREAVQAAQEARQAERDMKKAEDLASRARVKAQEAADNLKRTTNQEDAAKKDQGEVEKRKTAAEAELTKAQADLMAAQNKVPQDPLEIQRAQMRVTQAASQKTQAIDDLNAATARLGQATAAKASAAKADAAAAEDLREKESELNAAQAKLETKRNTEIAKREQWLGSEAKEDRAKEDQFRKEVAAAHEDPDTYVAGKIGSVDPVTQVSISVIGEGLIQLRGPIRGINKIRTMIDQIDSPMGQVKVGIFTVQINGEHGDRMEKVAQRIEGNIDVSRFLTSQSMMLLRRAVQEVASQVAQDTERGGHSQIDRDRKYLYAFFGRDFMDELYAANSEFLYSGNKVLSLHSMDTVSRSNALFVTAVAKNNIRQRILDRFMELVRCELPQAEYDFRKASKVLPCGRNTRRECIEKANELYTFRSLRGMFDVPMGDEQQDVMSPMQREFVRLAQIFKSQMVAEVELKQRVIERGLIEDREGEEEETARLLDPAHKKANRLLGGQFEKMVDAHVQLGEAFANFGKILLRIQQENSKLISYLLDVNELLDDIEFNQAKMRSDKIYQDRIDRSRKDLHATLLTALGDLRAVSDETKERIRWAIDDVHNRYTYDSPLKPEDAKDYVEETRWYVNDFTKKKLPEETKGWEGVRVLFAEAKRVSESFESSTEEVQRAFEKLFRAIDAQGTSEPAKEIRAEALRVYDTVLAAGQSESTIERTRRVSNRTRRALDHKKLLDFLIDEKEEKWIELREGTKSHIATMDNYLKRLAIALEDDFKVQFYDPAFVEVRKAAREWDVNLSQVERTTILTNNRQFAKVSPSATMEFDLPKREILIQEAMKGAKAMVEDYGALLQDPTFLAATKMLSGSPTSSTSTTPKSNVKGALSQGQAGPAVKTPLPGLPSSTEEQVLNQSTGQERELGAALEALIPDPAIYKFETGTGFEIRPVIQPDGDSIIYNFNYMYTTNVREPVRADEKHLGRVKRHFIDTQVQTSSFELREISRYQVALKASRTSRGVPLFEDIPGLGVLFRPMPSQESSLQQNIILGQSTVYPTLFDLMGLRWAQHIVDMDHDSLRDEEHVVRGRHKTIEDFVFDEASDKVDGFLGIKDDPDYKALRRPDLYRRQHRPSPYHPNGYTAPSVTDPTGKEFEIPDRRPPEMRDPMYEPLHRQEVPAEPIGSGARWDSTPPSVPPKLISPHSRLQTSSNSDSTVMLRASQPSDSGARPAAHEQAAKAKTKAAAKTESKPTVAGHIKKFFGW